MNVMKKIFLLLITLIMQLHCSGEDIYTAYKNRIAAIEITRQREIKEMLSSKSSEEKYFHAIHEAGHIVGSFCNYGMTIIVSSDIENRLEEGYISGGKTVLEFPFLKKLKLKDLMNSQAKQLVYLLSGGIAEQIFSIPYQLSLDTLNDDQKRLSELLSRFSVSSDIEGLDYTLSLLLMSQQFGNDKDQILLNLYKKGYKYILSHKSEVEKIADLLVNKNNILGDEIYSLLEEHKPLHENEEGPFPKEFAKFYKYRGDYDEAKDSADRQAEYDFYRNKVIAKNFSDSKLYGIGAVAAPMSNIMYEISKNVPPLAEDNNASNQDRNLIEFD